jgi:cyanate permease
MNFTAVMLQVNDSCSPKNLGSVNGLGQSLGALARAIGPGIGGILWSLAMQYNFIFMNFIGCVVMLIVCQSLNCLLPDRKKSTDDDNEQDIVFNEMGGA